MRIILTLILILLLQVQPPGVTETGGTLVWEPPTGNTDGTPLTEKIHGYSVIATELTVDPNEGGKVLNRVWTNRNELPLSDLLERPEPYHAWVRVIVGADRVKSAYAGPVRVPPLTVEPVPPPPVVVPSPPTDGVDLARIREDLALFKAGLLQCVEAIDRLESHLDK